MGWWFVKKKRDRGIKYLIINFGWVGKKGGKWEESGRNIPRGVIGFDKRKIKKIKKYIKIHKNKNANENVGLYLLNIQIE